MRLFVAGIRKLLRRPATYVTFGLLVGLLALIYIAVGATARQAIASNPNSGRSSLLLVTFPGAYTLLLQFILGLGGLFAMIYGAAVAGSEWTWGTLKAAVARGESRSRYQLLHFASIATMVLVGMLVAFGIGIVVTIVAAGLAQVPLTGLDDAATIGTFPEILARGWLALAEAAGLGLRDRDACPQPAGRDRRRDCRLLRRAVRADLPARHRQVLPVQRGERGRRDVRQLRRWRRRRGARPARSEHGVARRGRVADRRPGGHRDLHGTRRDLGVSRERATGV